MSRMVKGLVSLVVIVLLAGVIGASLVSADQPTPTPPNGPQAVYNLFVSKLAAALGKSEADTKAALTTAEKGMVDEALKQGKITQQQADQAKLRIDQGGSFGPMGPMMRSGRQGMGPGGRAPAKASAQVAMAPWVGCRSSADRRPWLISWA